MKILFINACVRPDSKLKIPNVGLAYVMTAAQRAGFDFDLIDIDAHRYSDEEVDRLVRQAKYDVVALGSLVSTYGKLKAMFRMIRDHHPNATIVTGNTLGTSIPAIVLERTEADVCVVGEGDETFVDLVRALDEGRSLRTVPGIAYRERGTGAARATLVSDDRRIRTIEGTTLGNGDVFVHNGERPVIENLDSIPFPNYDLFAMDLYLQASKHVIANKAGLPIPFEERVAMPVNTARGCAFHCNFCFHAFQDRRYRTRSAENILAEIKALKSKYGINYINFWDELTFFHIKQAETFADQMIEANLGIFWIASCRSELLVRREGGPAVAKKLKQANCHGLGFALETGDPDILKFMNKANTVNEFVDQCHVLHEASVDVYTSIIVGYPQETPETIDTTFRVLSEARVYPSVGFLQLMPKTPMYDYAREHGHITDEEAYLMKMGDRQDLRINLTKYDDEFLMTYTVEKLKALNAELKTNVPSDSLIKTKGFYAVKKKEQEEQAETFLEGFGVASDVLRSSDWTGGPGPAKC